MNSMPMADRSLSSKIISMEKGIRTILSSHPYSDLLGQLRKPLALDITESCEQSLLPLQGFSTWELLQEGAGQVQKSGSAGPSEPYIKGAVKSFGEEL